MNELVLLNRAQQVKLLKQEYDTIKEVIAVKGYSMDKQLLVAIERQQVAIFQELVVLLS